MPAYARLTVSSQCTHAWFACLRLITSTNGRREAQSDDDMFQPPPAARRAEQPPARRYDPVDRQRARDLASDATDHHGACHHVPECDSKAMLATPNTVTTTTEALAQAAVRAPAPAASWRLLRVARRGTYYTDNQSAGGMHPAPGLRVYLLTAMCDGFWHGAPLDRKQSMWTTVSRRTPSTSARFLPRTSRMCSYQALHKFNKVCDPRSTHLLARRQTC